MAAGVGTWMAAKGSKQLVSRGRPHMYMPDVVVRGGDGTGLGYISGHAAVAAVTAVVAIETVDELAGDQLDARHHSDQSEPLHRGRARRHLLQTTASDDPTQRQGSDAANSGIRYSPDPQRRGRG